MSESVKKAFHILDILSKRQGRCGLSDLGKILNINKSTLFRYLSSMEEAGVVVKNGNLYFLGPKLTELGHKVQLDNIVIDAAHPVLEALVNQVNETINLLQLSNNQALYLDKIEGNRSLQLKSCIGDKLPLYCTGGGKAILSILPEKSRDKLINSFQFIHYTNNTIQNSEFLKKEIQEIISTSYSIDKQEFEEGLICVAVPLHISELNFFGAVSFSGPAIRFTDEKQDHFVKLLKKAVLDIRKKLSHHS